MRRHISSRDEMGALPHTFPASNSGKRAMGLQSYKLLAVILIGFLFISGFKLSTFFTSIPSNSLGDDMYMGGLLAPRPQGDKCHSRSQHHLYRKSSTFKPSTFLVSKLREYETLHEKCAKEARNFNPNSDTSSTHGCQFLVWINYSGLGNKLVTLTAAFLYALITNRVLLVDPGNDINSLFCEPFPRSSWLIPAQVQADFLAGLNESSEYRFGRMVNSGECIPDARHLLNRSRAPHYVYLHLTHTYDINDRRFFCDEEQKFLRNVPWLFMRSNNYFVPSFYFMTTFRSELGQMFPDRETIFHHLARYLLHPTDAVWWRTTRFYRTYLSQPGPLVGLQLRTFDESSEALKRFSVQVLECVTETGLLPNVTYDDERVEVVTGKSLVSVLVTSLHQIYYESLKDTYVRFPTEDGTIVQVNLPSHEGFQRTDTAEHDTKALMEIFLLSFCDHLVTSPMSTFGYTAAGLAGLKPWVLRRLEEEYNNDKACGRAFAMEPCFHAPPLYDCDCRGGRNPAQILDFVRNCKDVHWGIQLANGQF